MQALRRIAISKIVAVVVAYNRRDLLAETLTALANQTRPVDAVVVVDNASTDGSGEMVASHTPTTDLVTLPTNTGGAGGFTVGIARALATHDADHIWVMDDDTVPTRTALEALERAQRRLPGARILASRVVWTDGRDHPMNTPRRWPFVSGATARRLASEDRFAFRSASFVSLFMPAVLIRDLGLPVADYFLWNDDFEYSTRLVRGGLGVYVSDSIVEHRTKLFGDTAVDPGERFYLEVRNKVWMFRHSRSLSLPEKALFGSATMLRWIKTYRRSSGRDVLRRGLRNGLRDGWSAPPRRNSEVLSGMGEVTELVASFERAGV